MAGQSLRVRERSMKKACACCRTWATRYRKWSKHTWRWAISRSTTATMSAPEQPSARASRPPRRPRAAQRARAAFGESLALAARLGHREALVTALEGSAALLAGHRLCLHTAVRLQ